jgi:hypothetical protein
MASINVDQFVRVQKHVTEIGERRAFRIGIGFPRGGLLD